MRKYLILLIFLISVPWGCGKEEIVKPSPDSLLATGAMRAIDAVKEAYEQKDMNGLQRHIGTYLIKNFFQELPFEKAELDFTPRLVKLNDASVSVNVTWHGSWWTEKAKKVSNRGVADFVFHQKTMKITYINGDNPFLMPVLGMRKIKEQK
jgi:hypothetical protein